MAFDYQSNLQQDPLLTICMASDCSQTNTWVSQ